MKKITNQVYLQTETKILLKIVRDSPINGIKFQKIKRWNKTVIIRRVKHFVYLFNENRIGTFAKYLNEDKYDTIDNNPKYDDANLMNLFKKIIKINKSVYIETDEERMKEVLFNTIHFIISRIEEIPAINSTLSREWKTNLLLIIDSYDGRKTRRIFESMKKAKINISAEFEGKRIFPFCVDILVLIYESKVNKKYLLQENPAKELMNKDSNTVNENHMYKMNAILYNFVDRKNKFFLERLGLASSAQCIHKNEGRDVDFELLWDNIILLYLQLVGRERRIHLHKLSSNDMRKIDNEASEIVINSCDNIFFGEFTRKMRDSILNETD